MKKCLIFSFLGTSICFGLNKLYQLFPQLGDQYYAQGINKLWVSMLSSLTGLIPFSVFELLIYSAILIVLVLLVFAIMQLLKTHLYLHILKKILKTTLYSVTILYSIFVLFWGLNYNRAGIAVECNLPVKERPVSELDHLYRYLLKCADNVRPLTLEKDVTQLFEDAIMGYEYSTMYFPHLKGNYGKPKPILASTLMNYTGITGIYSPFTGEANVNVSIPMMTLPVTILHEMAHQRGYTNEGECNFIAYIAAINHPQKLFQYSGYMLAIIYTGNALYASDPQLLYQANKQMSAQIKEDLEGYNTFWDKYEGKAEEFATKVNHKYLKANGVEDGVESYGKMIDLILAFYEKYSYNTR